MLELNKVRTSLYYFLKDNLDADDYGSTGYSNGDLVHLLDSDNEDDIIKAVLPEDSTGATNEIVLPIVVIDRLTSLPKNLQLGGGYSIDFTFTLTISGTTKNEVSDITSYLYNLLSENDIEYKDYDDGFPPDVTDQTVLGMLYISNVRESPIRIYGSPDVVDKYKNEITFDITLNKG